MILMKNFDMLLPEGRSATIGGLEYTIKKIPARFTLELMKLSEQKMSSDEWFNIMLDKTVAILNLSGYHLVTKDQLLDNAEMDQLTAFCNYIFWGDKDNSKNEIKGTTP